MAIRELFGSLPLGGREPGKLHRQIARFGTSVAGMPPLLASRGIDGELVISDAVTPATRLAKLLPGMPVRRSDR